MTGLLVYTPLDSCEVNSGKKPCELANVVALDGLSITVIRSHAAVLFGLFAQTPRSEPPAKAGAGSGPFWLGIGNEAQSALYCVLTAVIESTEPVCVSHDLMSAVDRFGWHMRNVVGVQDVITLPFIAKIAIAGWNEGSFKWRSIPREQTQLTQSTRYIETSTGLLNDNCDVVPVMMFLTDHRAGTIGRVVTAVKRWRNANSVAGAQLRLAAGNVGVMAATNETVKAKEMMILAGVFAAVLVMCLLTFRSVVGTILVVVPLALVSVLVYAVMALVGIGLKVSTLPMVALGAGIGVDYGIYLFSRMQEFLQQGLSVRDSYERTLRVTGASIIFTGITLAIGVATWVFSPLKFQADIGIMLTFMFLVNMLAAIILLPALAAWLIHPHGLRAGQAPLQHHSP